MSKLATLMLLLTRPSLRYEQTFYSEVRGSIGRGCYVQSAVDLSVGASTKVIKEYETTVENAASEVRHFVGVGDSARHDE